MLVPAAIGNVINSDTAESIDAKYVVEAANGPTTPEGDAILRKRGITVLPDIYTNGGKSLWLRLAVLFLCSCKGLRLQEYAFTLHSTLHSNTTGTQGGCCARNIGVTYCQACPGEGGKSCMYLNCDQEAFFLAETHAVQCPTLCAGRANTLQTLRVAFLCQLSSLPFFLHRRCLCRWSDCQLL